MSEYLFDYDQKSNSRRGLLLLRKALACRDRLASLRAGLQIVERFLDALAEPLASG